VPRPGGTAQHEQEMIAKPIGEALAAAQARGRHLSWSIDSHRDVERCALRSGNVHSAEG